LDEVASRMADHPTVSGVDRFLADYHTVRA
jgi:hypothetical protein